MRGFISILCVCCLSVLVNGCSHDSSPLQAIRIEEKEGKFTLYIDNEATYIKGIGGNSRLEMAAANGANAFRTWGGNVEAVQANIEKARVNDMYIMQGIGMTKDSASYYNEDYKNKVREQVRLLAETFKEDKQIFAWGLGNEIDLGKANIGAAWIFVEELAQLIKSIDKRHLVATVIAHNQRALDSIAHYAPTLDFVGINTYGSIVKLEEMVQNSDYKGAFMVTEWGPSGFWEVKSTEWGAPLEQTSEEKRLVYEARYTNYILNNDRCLGSFVFLWGQKEERTPTWFSMFVENDVEGLPLKGEKTPMVEAMGRVWMQDEPSETAPVISGITINNKMPGESVRIKAGQSFTGEIFATDREQVDLTYVWEILKEATVLGFGGSPEPRPDRVGEVVTTSLQHFTTKIHEPGNYRLYGYVLDNTGFVGTANIPFQISP